MIRPSLAATLVALAAGCTSPGVYDDPAVRILAAFPGLTYVDGDPEAGTTTMASLPLLTYRQTRRRAGEVSARTCFLPLLASVEQTDRHLEVTWAGAPKDPPPEEPGWWERRRQRRAQARRPTARPPAAEAAPGDDEPRRAASTAPAGGRLRIGPGSQERSAPRQPASGGRSSAAGPALVESSRGAAPADDPAAPSAAPPAARATDGEGRLVLELDEPAEVIRSLPLQQTDIHALFPLIHLRTERPAVALVRTQSGREAIYQAGPTRTSLRVLPLFSLHDGPRESSFMFWPLFSGYERDATGSYLRLFWFLRIRLSGPEGA